MRTTRNITELTDAYFEFVILGLFGEERFSEALLGVFRLCRPLSITRKAKSTSCNDKIEQEKPPTMPRATKPMRAAQALCQCYWENGGIALLEVWRGLARYPASSARRACSKAASRAWLLTRSSSNQALISADSRCTMLKKVCAAWPLRAKAAARHQSRVQKKSCNAPSPAGMGRCAIMRKTVLWCALAQSSPTQMHHSVYSCCCRSACRPTPRQDHR